MLYGNSLMSDELIFRYPPNVRLSGKFVIAVLFKLNPPPILLNGISFIFWQPVIYK